MEEDLTNYHYYDWLLSNLYYLRFLEFEEFCQLSAKFLIEEDEEGMKRELKEAFRIYDKAGTKDIYILHTISHYFISAVKLK